MYVRKAADLKKYTPHSNYFRGKRDEVRVINRPVLFIMKVEGKAFGTNPKRFRRVLLSRVTWILFQVRVSRQLTLG